MTVWNEWFTLALVIMIFRVLVSGSTVTSATRTKMLSTRMSYRSIVSYGLMVEELIRRTERGKVGAYACTDVYASGETY